jgi:predicted AAA+ superfamily ATPase
MYIEQIQMTRLKELIEPGKAVLVFGSRRAGKTTLLEHLIRDYGSGTLYVSGEDIAVRSYLESQSIEKLRAFIGDHTLLVVDEAQYVDRIGLNLKLLVDHVPGLRIVATGSSAFGLARDTGAPLAGRQYTLRLHPLSQMEIGSIEKPHETASNLEMRMLYGSYPEVVLTPDIKRRALLLRELVSSFLFKDIFQLEGIRKPDRITRLVQLLAFQIGGEVSVTELGTQLGMSKNTVDHYLDLLEKSFVIYSLSGFSRNLRKEITKSRRYYFWDNGIRNAAINNFNPIDLRDDVGMLWENYIMSERLKRNEYTGCSVNPYFWRTYDRKEIDLVESFGLELDGYEIKWSDKPVRPPRDWARSYPEATFQVINRQNYLPFIL